MKRYMICDINGDINIDYFFKAVFPMLLDYEVSICNSPYFISVKQVDMSGSH